MKRRRRVGYAVAIVVALAVCYAVWSRWDRRAPEEPTELRLDGIWWFGTDSGNGNLLGIQPHMTPEDYASEARFYGKLDGYLAEARKAGLIGKKTVVVFPEYLGVWLVAAGEKRGVHRAETVAGAIRLMVASNLLPVLRWMPASKARERASCALFKMKARAMAGIYQRTLSRLAREYGVTMVGGSIFLPNPRVEDGALAVGEGPLYNVSVVYGPEGRALAPLVRKAFPTEEERRYIAAGKVEELPIFETPVGRLGVLICADSWYPEAYRVLKERGVEVVAAPSFLYPDGAWERSWPGYSGGQRPADVEAGDEGRLREGEAWRKYALPGRIAECGARAGLNVFLRGKLWDLGSDGQAMAVQEGTLHTCRRTEGATIVNLWLEGQ